MKAIDDINLDNVVRKLTDPIHGKGWPREKATAAAGMYRRFLFLTVTQSDSIVPTELIDEVWHAHILDTRAYAADCERAFGSFLHHFPYFGLRGDDDATALSDAFTRTSAIYRRTFHEDYQAHVLTGTSYNSCNSCRGCSSCR